MAESWLNSVLQMKSACTGRLGRWIAALGFAASVAALAGERAPVREQIQFSSPGEPVESPAARHDRAPRFEFLDRDNSISGVVEPFVAPSSGVLPNLMRNARLFEAIDHKKNWIYSRPEDLNRSRTAEEMVGVRDPDGADKKPKTALENFFEDRGPKPLGARAPRAAGEWNRADTNRQFRRFDPESGQGTNFNSQFDHPLDSPGTVTAGFSPPGNLFAPSPGQRRWNDWRSLAFKDSLSGALDGGRNHADDFRKLLVVPGSVNPLVPGLDPINFQADTTGSLNPIIAPRATDSPGVDGNTFNPLRSLAAPAIRPNLWEEPGGHALGPSSLSPAVAAPTETPLTQQAKPVVLEFPQRKF